MVQALTPIEHFNTVLDADFSDDEVETVGGLLLQEIGLVSDLQGQTVELEIGYLRLLKQMPHYSSDSKLYVNESIL